MQPRITIAEVLKNEDFEERHILLKGILEERSKLLSKPAKELTSDDKLRLTELDFNKISNIGRFAPSRTPLMQAADDKDDVSINLLLAAGADANIQGYEGTALLLAMYRKHLDSVKALLNKDNINQFVKNKPPIAWACLIESEEISQLLLDNKANVNILDEDDVSPLMYAVVKGNTSLVKKMLEVKANITVKHPSGSTVIGYAVREGDVEMVEALVNAGADIHNNDGESLFIAAAQGNKKEIFDLLAKLYNKENIPPSQYINKINGEGYSALTAAIESKNVALVKSIIDMKADLNAHGGFATPAMFAASKCDDDPTILKLLINQKADLSTKVNKMTALTCAQNTGHTEIVMIIEQWMKYNSKTYRMFHRSIPDIDYEKIHKDALRDLIKGTRINLSESSENEVLARLMKMK